MKRKFQPPVLGSFRVPVLDHLKKPGTAQPRSDEDTKEEEQRQRAHLKRVSTTDGSQSIAPQVNLCGAAPTARREAEEPQPTPVCAAAREEPPSMGMNQACPAGSSSPQAGAKRLPQVGGLRRPQKLQPPPAAGEPAASAVIGHTRVPNSKPLQPGTARPAEIGAASDSHKAAAEVSVGAAEAAVDMPCKPAACAAAGNKPTQKRRHMPRLPSVLSSTLPSLEDLGVGAAIPSAKVILGSQQRLSLDKYKLQDLDDPSFVCLTSLVVQLEESLLPKRVEAMSAVGTMSLSMGAQVVVDAVRRKPDGGLRLAMSLASGLGAEPAKLGCAAGSKGTSPHPADAEGQQVATAPGHYGSPGQAQPAMPAESAAESAAGTAVRLVDGAGSPRCSLPTIDSLEVGKLVNMSRAAPTAMIGLPGQGRSDRPAAATDPSDKLLMPTPAAWDERAMRQLIGEQHTIPLSFLKRLLA